MFLSTRSAFVLAGILCFVGGGFVFLSMKDTHKKEIDRLESEIGQFREISAHCKDEIDKLRNGVENKEKIIQEKVNDITSKDGIIENLQKDLEGRRRELTDAQTRGNIEAGKNEELMKENEDLKLRINGMQGALDDKRVSVENAMNRVKVLESEIEELREGAKRATQQSTEQNETLAKTMKATILELTKELDLKDTKVKSCEEKMAELRKMMGDLTKVTQEEKKEIVPSVMIEAKSEEPIKNESKVPETTETN